MGHIGLAFFLNYLYERQTGRKINKLYLGLGSMFPDMIDKPIGSLLFNTGRWYGHSLLFLFIGLLLALSLTKLNLSFYKDIKYEKSTIFTFFIGALIHLLGDFGINPVVLFHPLLGPFPQGHEGDFLRGLTNLTTRIGEIIGSIFLCYLGMIENWNRKTWMRFLSLYILYISVFILAYYVIIGF